MKTALLTTCDTAIQAHILQGALASEGIESILHNENFTNLLPAYNNMMGGGVQILVMDCDYERAVQVLKPNEPQGKTHCPHCGSTDIHLVLGKRKGAKLFFATLSVLLAGTPIGNIHSVYQCRQCKGEFNVPE